jgi:hypothetical protein
LLLEDRGKLKTDDLLKKYLADAPASWDNMRVEAGATRWPPAQHVTFGPVW